MNSAWFFVLRTSKPLLSVNFASNNLLLSRPLGVERLGIDNFFEVGERLAPAQVYTIHEKSRRAVYAAILPSCKSRSTCALYLPLDKHDSNCLMSRASLWAISISESRPSLEAAKSASWYSQNLPCSCAQRDASAADC